MNSLVGITIIVCLLFTLGALLYQIIFVIRTFDEQVVAPTKPAPPVCPPTENKVTDCPPTVIDLEQNTPTLPAQYTHPMCEVKGVTCFKGTELVMSTTIGIIGRQHQKCSWTYKTDAFLTDKWFESQNSCAAVEGNFTESNENSVNVHLLGRMLGHPIVGHMDLIVARIKTTQNDMQMLYSIVTLECVFFVSLRQTTVLDIVCVDVKTKEIQALVPTTIKTIPTHRVILFGVNFYEHSRGVGMQFLHPDGIIYSIDFHKPLSTAVAMLMWGDMDSGEGMQPAFNHPIEIFEIEHVHTNEGFNTGEVTTLFNEMKRKWRL